MLELIHPEPWIRFRRRKNAKFTSIERIILNLWYLNGRWLQTWRKETFIGFRSHRDVYPTLLNFSLISFSWNYHSVFFFILLLHEFRIRKFIFPVGKKSQWWFWFASLSKGIRHHPRCTFMIFMICFVPATNIKCKKV